MRIEKRSDLGEKKGELQSIDVNEGQLMLMRARLEQIKINGVFPAI